MSDARAELEGSLRSYREATDDATRDGVLQRVWASFGRTCGVLVSDMSGFTRRAAQSDIVHFLALIQQCRELMAPALYEHGGSLVKTAADNVYAHFPTAAQAIDAAVAVQQCLQQHNDSVPPQWRFQIAVGIGYGEVLVLGDQDFFGHELNLAFKLGEDVARPGEILATTAALEHAGRERYAHELRTVDISGVHIEHAALQYPR